MEYQIAVPINLTKSLRRKFFVGYADQPSFGQGANAWLDC